MANGKFQLGIDPAVLKDNLPSIADKFPVLVNRYLRIE